MRMQSTLTAAAIVLAAAVLAGPAGAQVKSDVPDMAVLNPDGDGTVDLTEAKTAAEALWAKINAEGDDALRACPCAAPDGEETLEPDETVGRIEGDDWTAANPDGDRTIEKDEFLALVEARFKAADPDNDGTVDEAEFGTDAGKKLLSLLQE